MPITDPLIGPRHRDFLSRRFDCFGRLKLRVTGPIITDNCPCWYRLIQGRPPLPGGKEDVFPKPSVATHQAP